MRKKQNIKRVIVIATLLLGIILLQAFIPNIEGGLSTYNHYFFMPFQRAKLWFFSKTEISFGDISYILLLVLLAYNLGRLIYQFTHRLRRRRHLGRQAYFATIFILCTYFLFVLFWGINYQKPNLWKQWPESHTEKFEATQSLLLQQMLVDSLSAICKLPMVPISDKEVNIELLQTYQGLFRAEMPRLKTKFSAFGNLLQSMGINGYYNPLTSEAQFNRNLPAFLHSFVMAHEMAHQTGIAAEGDANLMAYIVCVQSAKPQIRYSGYLNIYLYNERALGARDNAAAIALRTNLPAQAIEDLAALQLFQKKNYNSFSKFTMSFYNIYLKINGENQGLRAYRNVNKYVYVWEFLTKRRAILIDGPVLNK